MRQTNITKEDAYINREISKQMAGNGFRTFPKGEKGTLQSIKKRPTFFANNYPETDFADAYFTILTIIPQQIFLEKAFLLHEEFQKPLENVRINRMS